MRIKNNSFVLSAILVLLIGSLSLPLLAQQQEASRVSTNEGAQSDARKSLPVTPGQELKIEGVIVNREADNFTLRDESGSELIVRLTDATKVEEKKRNSFRSAKKYDSDQLIRGLNVEVEGRGDRSGTLVAEKIKFRESDLMVARTVVSQVVPIEERLGQTENRLSQTEQNAQRLSGQVEEMTEVANVARGGAKAAQETADKAIAGVDRTNQRISALDDYEVRNSVTINFRVNSATLLPEAEATLDQIANQAKTEKGFVIEVSGFASADGPEDFNRRLSERRAQAVIRYLVETHDIPLRRIIIPFGYGEMHPLADNSTREGREQNRRVEVRILVSRGLTMSATE
jgi:outer membrane protein OmpA-like peptidoglycan-associated protein